jgi:hypothetical protein
VGFAGVSAYSTRVFGRAAYPRGEV